MFSTGGQQQRFTTNSILNPGPTNTAQQFDETLEPGQAGVGIYFQTEGNDGRVYVKSLVMGGSADRDGTVQVGDIVQTVDGGDVVGQSLAVLRQLILGETGTYVTLGFLRADNRHPDSRYEISLMRGTAEHFASIRARSAMQDELDRLRRALITAEEELERLRKQLRQTESSADREKQDIEQLRKLLRTVEEQLQQAQLQYQEEVRSRRALEGQVRPLHGQIEQDQVDLDRLRRLLRQAEDQLKAVQESLLETQRRHREEEARCAEEEARRLDCEAREKQLLDELQIRMQEQREYREAQEKMRRDLDEERARLEKELREEGFQRSEEIRKREEAEVRARFIQEQRQKVEADNERLHQLLRESENARAGVDQQRSMAEEKNHHLSDNIRQMEEQTSARHNYINDLKRKLEDERHRWESVLHKEQEERRRDSIAHKEREQALVMQLQTLGEELRAYRESQDDILRKVETEILRAEHEKNNVDAALRAEKALAAQLRDHLQHLSEQVAHVEHELATTRDALERSEAQLKQVEIEKLRSQERERAIEEELQRQLEKEVVRTDYIEEVKKRMEAERFRMEEAMRRQETLQHDEEVKRIAVEEALSRAQNDLRNLTELEKRRTAHDEQWHLRHRDELEKFHQLVNNQATLGRILGSISVPEFPASSEPLPDFDVMVPNSLLA